MVTLGHHQPLCPRQISSSRCVQKKREKRRKIPFQLLLPLLPTFSLVCVSLPPLTEKGEREKVLLLLQPLSTLSPFTNTCQHLPRHFSPTLCVPFVVCVLPFCRFPIKVRSPKTTCSRRPRKRNFPPLYLALASCEACHVFEENIFNGSSDMSRRRSDIKRRLPLSPRSFIVVQRYISLALGEGQGSLFDVFLVSAAS